MKPASAAKLLIFISSLGKYKLIFLCYCDPLGKRKIRLCDDRGNKS